MSRTKAPNSAIAVISWKAKQLGLTYGELTASMKEGDLAKYAKEFEQAKTEAWMKLHEEGEERRKHRKCGDPDFSYVSPKKKGKV